MHSAIRLKTTVQPGHRLEITAPELPEGATVEVIVFVLPSPAAPRQSMIGFLATLPPGPRSYPTWEEIDKRFQEERDAWDR